MISRYDAPDAASMCREVLRAVSVKTEGAAVHVSTPKKSRLRDKIMAEHAERATLTDALEWGI